MALIDHLVLAVPDLEVAVDEFEREHGVRPSPGGRHLGVGTHNALVSLGSSYLELIAPDPDQPDPEGPRPFGVDDVDAARLTTFAARPDPSHDETIESLVAACAGVGHDPGPIAEMSRATPSGDVLSWRLTMPSRAHDGLVPFLISWGDTTHPATTASGGVELAALRGTTAEPDRVNVVLRALGLPAFATACDDGPPGLIAEFVSSER